VAKVRGLIRRGISLDFWIEVKSLPVEDFDGAQFEVITFDDVTVDEQVVEFRRAGPGDPLESFAAVVIVGSGGWDDAVVSINPRAGDIPVRVMLWLIDTARRKMEALD
jgi:hypothetical protein